MAINRVKKLNKLADLPVVYCNGILFVGDPHLTAKRPARRLDGDYLGTLENKLMQTAMIANEHELTVMILGDLFDRAVEKDDNRMLAILFRFLNAVDKEVFCLAGNHDMTETQLTPDTTLHLVAQTGLMHVIDSPGFFARLIIKGESTLVGGTPSGMVIPDEAPCSDEIKADTQHRLWITHEDLAFPGSYPHSLEFKVIKDIELVVNGHMHQYQEPHIEGETTWFNPGNIIRKSIKEKNEIPSVWAWHPGAPLRRHKLTHVKDAFNLQGLQVEKAGNEEVMESLLTDGDTSQFVEMLKNDIIDGHRSDDGGILRETLSRVTEHKPMSEVAAKTIDNLINQIIFEQEQES